MNSFLPKLYKVTGSRAAQKQSTQEWFVTVDEEEGSFTTHAGKLGGKIKPKLTLVKPKNVGKSSETTVAQQAVIEAKAKWKYQVDRKLYKVDLEDGIPPLYLPPMLAMDATKHPHRIDWVKRSYISQPKLNGVRVLAIKEAEGVVKLQSREGTFYTIPHIQEALDGLMNLGCHPLDGELYLGEDFELGDVTGSLKPGHGHHENLMLHLFDIAHPTDTAIRRQALLRSIVKRVPYKSPLHYVPWKECESFNQLDLQHDEWAAKGFEGIMLRDTEGLYDYGEKNIFMFKYKKFVDEEFKISGVRADKDGGGLMVLYTDNSKFGGSFEGEVTEPTFTCRCKGTDAQRADILAHPEQYVGKLLTVRFSARLKSGVPEFNRGITKDGMIAVRDYE